MQVRGDENVMDYADGIYCRLGIFGPDCGFTRLR